MNVFPIELAILLLVTVGGTAFLARFRALERRIFSIESSLGGFAGLGAGGEGDPMDDDQVLRYLDAMNRSLIGELKSTEDPAPKSAQEP